ncbi:MAG TPA: peptidase C11 [Lachnospiraceae bacterium]|nr:peptidase C11 [Lachnospiraceae bacterium]
MEERNRPRAREKYVTNNGKGVGRKGEGLGTGPVGSSDSQGRRGESGEGHHINKAAAIGGGGGILAAIIGIIMMLFSGGGAGGGSGSGGSSAGGSQNIGGGTAVTEDIGSGSASDGANYKLDTTVAAGSREKRTKILGNNQDTITFMVFMCGTDLESKYGMSSADLSEMASADFGDNINIIVYTGGCSKWKTNGISNKVNQIFQVKKGSMTCLVTDDGNKPMTDPDTLSGFIKYCATNFPANRYELIMWDHGGGSVSGYGYDEKYKNSGSMTLSGINKALKDAGVTFDMIGFDACLMATAETALMLDPYADYMVASEETEPGIGWFYTNWLTKLGANTSMSTLELGKLIIDDYTYACKQKCRGQATTLSLIDLAEFANTVPSKIGTFSKSVSGLITNKEYKQVSDARNVTREFAQSSRIDQVDLVNLAQNMKTSEGEELAKALKGAVKYNRTSLNMTDAYGVSIYFPYQRTSYVDKACQNYSAIGMNDEYSKCIRQFASLETSGQIQAGGSSNAGSSLFDLLGGGSGGGSDSISNLLGAFFGGRSHVIDDLDESNTDFMDETDVDEAAEYISNNYFDPTKLVWEDENGTPKIALESDQLALIHSIDQNLFYDDGTGYLDLGLDNIYSYDDDGKIVADVDRTWISINGQPVAYYHLDTVENGDDYTITGRVPAIINGTRVNLILVFDNENPKGYIAGYQVDYREGETDAVAKIETDLLNETDGSKVKVTFICDYYSYDMVYQDSYVIGYAELDGVTDVISNTDVGEGKVKIAYLFTDIYNQKYWTPTLSR